MDTFIYFSWHSLSSGEKAFLSFLARINYAKKMILNEKDEEVVKDVILIIDEFDLYLHPEWQRVFFNTLIKQLPIIFPSQKIQLLISSHSPFLISDLPRNNVIILKKGESGTYIDDEVFRKQTFGANIHELFTDSFFLHDGLLGEFARNKITTLIDFLNSVIMIDEENQLDEASSRDLINLIGEPLIKDHLMDMWEQKFSKDDNRSRVELIKEIELLKEKIKFLSL